MSRLHDLVALAWWWLRCGLRLSWLEWMIAFKREALAEVNSHSQKCGADGDVLGALHCLDAVTTLHSEIVALQAECRLLKSLRP